MSLGIARGLRRTLPGTTLALLTACGSWARVGTESAPTPVATVTSMLDETGMFRRIGRLADSS